MRKQLIGLAALASAAAPANAANILVNGGFETGSLTPWTVSYGTPSVTSAEAHSGLYSAAATGLDAIKQVFAPVATSSINEISVWALNKPAIPFDAYYFYYQDGSSSSFLINGSTGGSWQYFNLTSNLAAGKNLVGFSIYGTSPGPTYLDDFKIETTIPGVPEPASWAMMIAGFAGAGAAMRRKSRRASVRFAA